MDNVPNCAAGEQEVEDEERIVIQTGRGVVLVLVGRGGASCRYEYPHISAVKTDTCTYM